MAHTALYERYSTWEPGKMVLDFTEKDDRDLRDAGKVGRALRALRKRGGTEMGKRPITALLYEAQVFNLDLPPIKTGEFGSERDIVRVLFP